MTFSTLTLLSAAALSSLTGCALGPDYHGPQDASTPAQFSRASKDPSIRTSAPLAQWWKSLNDAELNNLIERALAATTEATSSDEQRYADALQAIYGLPMEVLTRADGQLITVPA